MSKLAELPANCLRISTLLLTLATCLYGGRYFPVENGETVVPDELIVRLQPGTRSDSVLSSFDPGAQVTSGKLDMHVFKTSRAMPLERLNALAAHPQVQFVEPNRLRQIRITTPNDPYYASRPALSTIQAVGAWQSMPGSWILPGQHLKVAVLDTGTDCLHPDFAGAGGSTESSNGGQLDFARSVALEPTTITGAPCGWQDDHGHGTHVAGHLAAATQSWVGVGSAGYPLEIITYKVVNSTGQGDDMSIATAIVAATDAGAKIVLLSLGGPGYSQALQTAVNYAWANNVLVVAAAGDANSHELFFPAGANHVVAVAATDGYARATFSNYGSSVSVAARGMDVLSTGLRTKYPTGYVSMSGTSMAMSHVSALAGLLAMTAPGVAVESVVQRLQQSATGNTGWTQTLGYGVINAQTAISGTALTSTPGSITGQVVDASSNPVRGATISVAGTSVSTDTSGLFRIPNLGPGTYALTFSASTQPSRILNVAVAPGADTPVVLVAGVQTGSVRGVVTSAGQAVPAVIVYALSGGVRRATAVTGTDGRYELLLPADTYEIRASSLGYVTASGGTITVAVGARVSADVALTRFTSVRGFANDSSGAVVPGAEIGLSGPGMAGEVAAADGSFSTTSLADNVPASAVAWSGNSSVGTISSTGLDTASPDVLGSQTITEIPTSTQFAGLSKTAKLTLTADATETPAATSIWNTAATPDEPWRLDNPLTLGVKFRSDVAGEITGIRFWKASPNDSGTHLGLLYTSSGALLAQATFTAETTGGWQQVNFATPVAISPGVTYVAAYHTTSGVSAHGTYFLNTGADAPPLHALKSGVDGANGLYSYGAPARMPVSSRGANYWVDVVFASASDTSNPGPSAAATSLWNTAATPNEPWRLDNPVTLGVKFRSDVAGQITGIRFWKASPNDSGTHSGLLYTSTGTLLAQATFTAETTGAWQQVNFATPVSISPGVTYIAAYHTTSGFSAHGTYFLDTGVYAPPLHALQSGVDGANGLYSYGTPARMPVSSRGANYWVDVVFAAQATGTAPQLPSVSAGSAALIDADTGETIWSVAATTRRPMASTTKGMTLLLLYELLGPDLASKTVTVPYAATMIGGTTAGLGAGEQISAEELAYGLMLPSGNDAAYAIAHHVGVALGAAAGQAAVDRFVARMNQRAAQLGLADTQFKNPHGMDAVGHYTTALDLAKMYRAIFAVPKLQQIARTVSYVSLGGRGWDNTNNLLGAFPGTIAGKDGRTQGAKQCLVVLYGRGGKRFVGTLLGSDDPHTDMVSVLEYGNRLYARQSEKQYGRSNSHHAAPAGGTPGWYKSGFWPHYIDGYGHWSTTVGAKATYQFYGTGVKMITSTGPAWGRVDVALDGGAPAMVDLYSPGSIKKGVEVWSASGLTDGWHTLTITLREDRNPAATDRIAVLDEFWTER